MWKLGKWKSSKIPGRNFGLHDSFFQKIVPLTTSRKECGNNKEIPSKNESGFCRAKKTWRKREKKFFIYSSYFDNISLAWKCEYEYEMGWVGRKFNRFLGEIEIHAEIISPDWGRLSNQLLVKIRKWISGKKTRKKRRSKKYFSHTIPNISEQKLWNVLLFWTDRWKYTDS